MVAQAPTQHAVLISAGPRQSAKRWARFVRPDQLHYRAQVRRLVNESKDAVSVVLAPDNGIPESVRAGQFYRSGPGRHRRQLTDCAFA